MEMVLQLYEMGCKGNTFPYAYHGIPLKWYAYEMVFSLHTIAIPFPSFATKIPLPMHTIAYHFHTMKFHAKAITMRIHTNGMHRHWYFTFISLHGIAMVCNGMHRK